MLAGSLLSTPSPVNIIIIWLCSESCVILVPWPGMEPAPSALEAWSLNHWTAREVSQNLLFVVFLILSILPCVRGYLVVVLIYISQRLMILKVSSLAYWPSVRTWDSWVRAKGLNCGWEGHLKFMSVSVLLAHPPTPYSLVGGEWWA